ncbi:MAG: hypothetical protein GW939_03880 [Candidatus Magasanikbacteria bacterium]|nr:hypothetical protein [Candidatus Magasanikbacteria bacterium]NCS72445.1 hypothetical protein [Candidatus Magasanikbacteria bacterium]
MPHRIAKQIFNAIQKSRRILLVPHKNPDGDALGSVASFMQFLRSIEKPHTAFCSSPISDRLNYLPHLEYITNDKRIWDDPSYDLVIVFDSGDLRYAGIADDIAKHRSRLKIINIDHHPTNELFGDLNLVNTSASSTTEILYHFFKYNDITITSEIATCLLTGLITDTDNFTNAATSITSFSISSDLISHGGNLNLIRGWVFQDKSIKALKLWGTVLSRLKKHEDLDIVYTYITQDDLQEHNVNESEAEGLANFLNTIGDGKAGLILKELPDGKTKGSFRTTHDNVDVGAMSMLFGGGGHKKAAGFTIDVPYHEAFAYIFTKLSEEK